MDARARIPPPGVGAVSWAIAASGTGLLTGIVGCLLVRRYGPRAWWLLNNPVTPVAQLKAGAAAVDCDRDPAFGAAIRLARALAIAAVRNGGELLDIAAVRRDLDGIRDQLKAIRGMKAKLSSVANVTLEVRNALDVLREGVLACVTAIEGNLADVNDKRDVA